MTSTPATAARPRALLSLLLALAAAWGFWASIRAWLGAPILDLGSLNSPTPRLMAAWDNFAIFGSLCAAAVAWHLHARMETRDWDAWYRMRRQPLLWATAAVIFAVALFLRFVVLARAPLTDDESAYLFAAHSLLRGHLWENSPPLKEFYDRVFLINDGRMHSQYFLGWPALLAPAVAAGMGDLLNPLLCALTVFPLARLLERYCRAPAVLAGLAWYAASMTSLVTAATLLAYTSALFFLTWYLHLVQRLTHDADAAPRDAALAALCGSMAFFIRPSAVVMIGAPATLLMLVHLLRSRPAAGRTLLAPFAGIAAAFATLFLYLNQLIYGNALSNGYDKLSRGYSDYLLASVTDIGRMLETATAGLQRLTADISGWPLPLLALLAVLLAGRRLWVFSAALALEFCTCMVMSDLGIDTFGPLHLLEATTVFILLLSLGMQRLTDALAPPLHSDGARVLLSTALGLVIAAWLTYFPLRVLNVGIIAANVNGPLHLAARLPEPSVIFARRPFVYQNSIAPLRHYVFFMPISHPDMNDRVIWANNLGERNAELLRTLPGRKAYTLEWDDAGRPQLQPYAAAD